MKKITTKRLLAFVLALVMVIGLCPVLTFTASATETEAAADTVKIGAEVLLESEYWQNYLSGKNVALFTNQVCVDAEMNHLADKLAASENINLVCLFGGEHGLRGAAQAGAAVSHCIDATTGLINWSLYSGGTIDTDALGIAPLAEGMENPSSPNRPTRAMITGNNGAWYEPIDVILFDLQEIGSKTWTYLYNLADLMGACIEAKKYYGQEVELIVLDRPSPIGSDTVEGTMHASNNQTGFARLPIPSRYGLTMGEVALLYQGEGWTYFWEKTYPGGPSNLYGSTTSLSSKTYKGLWPWENEVKEGDSAEIIAIKEKLTANFSEKLSFADCPVTVIPCEGYTRDMYWDETGLEFILPSPNMPTAEACLLYTGTVWFEGQPINEGRGTTQPFTTISAPYITDADALAERLNGFGLDGVIFRPAHTTTLSTNQLLASTDYVGRLAHGVQIHVTDKRAFSPIEMQVYLMLTLQAMYGWETAAEKKDGEHYFTHYQLDYRSGSDWCSTDLAAFPKGASDEQIVAEATRMLALMDEQTADYKVIREKYLLDEYNTPEDKELVQTLEPQVMLGAEVYLKSETYGNRVTLVVNQSSVTTDLEHIVDLLNAKSDLTVVSVITTGYGLRGEFQTAEDGVYTDAKTGLTVYRVHENGIPAEAIANAQGIVFDLQDTGSRYNGTVELMAQCIQAANTKGIPFTVLDRPNPIGADAVEGPVDDTYGIATRHGMTNGELAFYLAKKLGIEGGIGMVKMFGYTRDMLWADTGLQFIQTDRKIGTAEALLTYAALGWLEGVPSVSYGWGTTKTYEFFGAPYMKEDMVDFADELNALELPGVRFRLAAMTPWNNTTELASIRYPSTACYGVQMHILDEEAYNAVDTILGILYVMKEFFPDDFDLSEQFNEIVGSNLIADGINNGRSLPELMDSYRDGLNEFKAAREECLAYSNEAESYVDHLVNTMSLRDKVTQMMMPDFRQWTVNGSVQDFTVMNDEVRQIIEDYNFGAVIYFANNIKTTEETFALTQEMQAAATKDGGIALLIGADQEGGSVYRLGSGTALPGNMALGATYTANGTKYANWAGKIIGSELSVLGINTNLAPVVDVNNNANNPVIGLRSYGDDAVMVGELASASIAGMAEYNVIGTAKHFPGHGDTGSDSHYDLPVVDKSLDVLMENELAPYLVAIEQGIEMIMTAHILYPQLESDKILSNKTGKEESLPATMSDDILTGLLKGQMGFEGIVVTDAMNMAGIASCWDEVQSVIIAINAGVDMFCMPTTLRSTADLANLDAIINGVIAAVESGEIPMSRIDDAVTRILTVKENRGILDYNAADYSLEEAQAVVGSEENRAMERELAAAAVTVVKNDGALPLNLTSESKVLMLCPYNNERAQMLMAWNRAKDACLIPEGAQVDYYRFSSTTINSELQAKLDWADTYIIITEVSSVARMEYKHWLSAAPNNFCDYAAANGKTAIIASCDKPYDVQMYPNANAILAAYGCKGSSEDPTETLIGSATGSKAAYGPNIIAAVEVALGTFEAQGTLPVNIPKYDVESNSYTDEIVYERGYGLTYEAKVATEHVYEWTVVTAPTCTEPGVETGVCPHGETATREIPALGHNYENGVCTGCGDVLVTFTDIVEGEFYYDAVLWAVGKGITTGATETTFNPTGELQRAQVVVMLWRAAGQPEPTTTVNPFSDVTEADFFYKAVLWAVETGITTGTSATEFSPYGVTNRAQAVTFLWRFLGKPATTGTNSFTDVEAGQWYEAPINWAVEKGITNGMGDGIFGINTACNRAHAVTFIYRTFLSLAQ